MWGIIPAAGAGRRIQPLAFSKELLPVGSRFDGETERPRAVSEYIIERMVRAGATRICLVISPGKCDILEYYGASFGPARLCYVVQAQPSGLCDALFCALPLIGADDPVMVGLPDTIWFPEDGFCSLPLADLSFLLFPVTRPELFDAVLTDEDGRVRQIRVKAREPLKGDRPGVSAPVELTSTLALCTDTGKRSGCSAAPSSGYKFRRSKHESDCGSASNDDPR
jgi:glucose-1-phosphate thymidylyltransferase